MSEFFAMGGYAFFVWSAWGLSAAVLAGLAAIAVIERRKAEQRLRTLQEEEAG